MAAERLTHTGSSERDRGPGLAKESGREAMSKAVFEGKGDTVHFKNGRGALEAEVGRG